MFSKNNLAFGLLTGSLLPALCWIIFRIILQNEAIIRGKPAAPYLIAMVLNLLLLRYYFRNDMEKAANGVMMITFAFMLSVFLFKIRVNS